MKLPRDINSKGLIKLISQFGYTVTRQTGSHIRLTTNQNGNHNLTIPNHNPIKIGTLNSILNDIANHFNMDKNELIFRLFED